MNDSIPQKVSNEILFGSCAKFGDEFYGSLHKDGMTFKMNLATGNCSLIGVVSNYAPVNSSTVWDGTIAYGRYEKYLFLLEITCERIAIYDMENGNVDYINLGMKYYTDLQFSVSLVTSYKDRLFIFPCFDDQLMIVNMSKKMVEDKLPLYPSISYEYKEEKHETIMGILSYPVALFSQALRVENNVYLFSHVLQEVLKFSLTTLQVERIPIYGNYRYLVDVAYRNENFYMLDGWGNVYLWREKTRIVELEIATDHNEDGYYNRVLPTEKNIWILPCWGKDIRIVNKNTKTEMVYNDFPKDFYYLKLENYSSKYGYGCEDEYKYYLAAYCSNYILTIDKNTGEAKWIFPKGLGDKEKKIYLCDNGVINSFQENLDFDLNDYLLCKAKKRGGNDKLSLGIGENIWKNISE